LEARVFFFGCFGLFACCFFEGPPVGVVVFVGLCGGLFGRGVAGALFGRGRGLRVWCSFFVVCQFFFFFFFFVAGRRFVVFGCLFWGFFFFFFCVTGGAGVFCLRWVGGLVVCFWLVCAGLGGLRCWRCLRVVCCFSAS